MNWAWRQNLPSTAKLVLLALADAADDEGNCWPSVATIAGKAGVTTRTVRRRHIGSIGHAQVTSVAPLAAANRPASSVGEPAAPNPAKVTGAAARAAASAAVEGIKTSTPGTWAQIDSIVWAW